jgi:hypothetical protein
MFQYENVYAFIEDKFLLVTCLEYDALRTSTMSFYISRKIMSSAMRIFYAMIPLVKSVTRTLNLNPLYLIRCSEHLAIILITHFN